MNVNAALQDTIIRIVKGEKVRVKSNYKDTIFSIMKLEYPVVKIMVDSEDEQYCYIKKIQEVSPGFTPEEMARAVHDCNGNPVTHEDGIITGYNPRGQVIHDVSSTQCLAKKVAYTDKSKNEFYIATNREGGLLNPVRMMGLVRSGWVKCNEHQFNLYLEAARTGREFSLREIKNQLNIN